MGWRILVNFIPCFHDLFLNLRMFYYHLFHGYFISCFTIHCILYFMFHCQMLFHKSFIICFVFALKFSVQIEPRFSVPLTKSFAVSLGPIRYTTRSKDGSQRMRGVRCYENATLLRPVRKLTIPPSERHFAYYPLAN